MESRKVPPVRRLATRLLAGLPLVALFVPHAAAQNLFFGSIASQQGPNFLLTSDLNGGGLTNILPSYGGPVSIDVDPSLQRVFWSDHLSFPGSTGNGPFQARSASFTGAAPALIATYPGASSYGLAVDAANQRVYWADGSNIQRSDYNGANTVTVASNVYTFAIEVDPVAGKILWTDAATPSIRMANLDGTNPQTLITLATGTFPSGITVSPATQTVFWSDFSGGTVSSMAYSGGPVSTLLSGRPRPAGLDYEPVTNRLYIVDKSGSVGWTTPAGGPLTTVFTGAGSTLGEMWDIAAVIPAPGSGAMLLALGLTCARRARRAVEQQG